MSISTMATGPLTRTVTMSVITRYTETGHTRVSILEDLLSENDRVADDNGGGSAATGVRAVNLMSSPGAAKTTPAEQDSGAV